MPPAHLQFQGPASSCDAQLSQLLAREYGRQRRPRHHNRQNSNHNSQRCNLHALQIYACGVPAAALAMCLPAACSTQPGGSSHIGSSALPQACGTSSRARPHACPACSYATQADNWKPPLQVDGAACAAAGAEPCGGAAGRQQRARPRRRGHAGRTVWSARRQRRRRQPGAHLCGVRGLAARRRLCTSGRVPTRLQQPCKRARGGGAGRRRRRRAALRAAGGGPKGCCCMRLWCWSLQAALGPVAYERCTRLVCCGSAAMMAGVNCEAAGYDGCCLWAQVAWCASAADCQPRDCQHCVPPSNKECIRLFMRVHASRDSPADAVHSKSACTLCVAGCYSRPCLTGHVQPRCPANPDGSVNCCQAAAAVLCAQPTIIASN